MAPIIEEGEAHMQHIEEDTEDKHSLINEWSLQLTGSVHRVGFRLAKLSGQFLDMLPKTWWMSRFRSVMEVNSSLMILGAENFPVQRSLAASTTALLSMRASVRQLEAFMCIAKYEHLAAT